MTAVFQPSLATKNLRSISRLMSGYSLGYEARWIMQLHRQNSVMNSRRLPRNSIRKPFGINDAPVSSILVRSFDHLVRSGEQLVGDGEPECLGGLEIDDKVEFGWL